MAISSTSTDYTGRKKDISVLHSADTSIVGKQPVLPQFGKTGRFCTGVQKLIQKYAIVLLTNLNSQENYPTFGTDFLYSLRAGISPVDDLQASAIFHLANYDTVALLKTYQINNPDIPADERLARATLSKITLYGDYVGFDVTITTEAGDVVPFIVPLPK